MLEQKSYTLNTQHEHLANFNQKYGSNQGFVPCEKKNHGNSSGGSNSPKNEIIGSNEKKGSNGKKSHGSDSGS